jgi:hypothetical protein
VIGAGLFKKVPSPDDQLLQRIQDNVADAFDALAAAVGVLAIPVLALTASAPIAPGRALVVFKGNTGQTLTLPLATAQGQSVGAVVILVNVSGNTVTVRPAGADTLDGGLSITVTAGTFVVLVADGVGKWQSK